MSEVSLYCISSSSEPKAQSLSRSSRGTRRTFDVLGPYLRALKDLVIKKDSHRKTVNLEKKVEMGPVAYFVDPCILM